MVDLRKAAELALDFLESGMPSDLYGMDKEQHQTAITALRQALDHVPDTMKMTEPDMGIDRGAWDDVPDATKWVDELRGGDETEQEPVVYLDEGLGAFYWPKECSSVGHNTFIPLYTAPPKREWQGLTDEELRHAYGEVSGNEWCLGGISNAETFCDIIEAKLKEKNT